jgi:NodT family efflux transporter outer membrane factor (OMF) lipoprotein
MRRVSSISIGLIAIAVAGCSVGPDYQRPQAVVPTHYKEADGWKPASPQLVASNDAWWSIYNDPILDGLERQIDISNQTLKASEAAYRASEAIVGEARAGFFPTLGGTGGATRSGRGATSSSSSSSSSTSANRGGTASNSFAVGLQASWTPDIWGSIRRTVESDVANAQASAADLAAARLSAQATLAADYFQLRVNDELKQLLDAEVAGFDRSMQITRNRYNAGVAARTDLASATAQLENARAQSIAAGVQRAQFEHAIAVLIGKAPADLTITPSKIADDIPVTPPDLPSVLLERNPTIAAAERSMAAANARIGVAVAGYYPTITLGASYGQQSSMLNKLLSAGSSLWSFGLTSINLPIFNGGLTAAQVAEARATYDQAVAQYRQAVLTGFQQVEDQLAAVRILEQQAAVQGAAVAAAREAEQLALNQYRAGTVDFTTVVTAQATSLSNQETAVNIRQSRLVASVNLIQALGGGWDAKALPSKDQIDDTPESPAAP